HKDPEVIALRDKHRSVSFGDLSTEIATRAVRLQGLSCVALAMDNGVEWVLWDLAALQAGAVIVPLPPFFTQAQREHALRSAGCQALITAGGLQKLSYPLIKFPQGTVKVTYTSGTTGTPRGVCLSEEAQTSVAQSIVGLLGKELAPGIHCSVLPLAVLLENVAGVYAALLAGCTVYIPSLLDLGAQYEGLYDQLQHTNASSAILVPEILRTLIRQVAQGAPLPALRYVAVGGSTVATALISLAHTMGLPVYEGYGLSECASVVALNVPGAAKTGTTGKILPHLKADIVNNEIVITNPGFLGYVGTTYDGTFATGDLGRIDRDGFLIVTGRKKNILITSYGRNIAPEWVESQLLLQPEILQAVVSGDGEPRLSALLVPSSPEADLAAAIARTNAELPTYAHIMKFRAVPPFTVQNGLLTGTGRPRRDAIHNHYEKENTMSFYDRLTKETEAARNELYAVPQLIDGLRGDINRETYIAYLTEAYHHVRHTVRFLMAMGVRLPEEKKWLHDAISEYIEEEKGHEEWILNDIAAAGGDKEAARMATPNLETQVLIAYNYDYIARKNPVGFLGMVFMLESTSIQIANNGADAVRSKLGLPKSAFTYLYSHGALDMEHMKFFEKTVNMVRDPDDQAAIIEVASNTFRLFAGVMRAIPHDKAARHAA
ncbi:MAG: AMP-binding protein, partial [Alphaproteobacteria bacterium]|nr:AMP-binding protein [Alphaproteobacteria bacterium]